MARPSRDASAACRLGVTASHSSPAESATTTDPDPEVEEASDSVVVLDSDLQITKEALSDPVPIGDTVDFKPQLAE